MRVLHVMPSMDPAYGGPVAAMHGMAQGLKDVGVSLDIVTVHPGGQSKSVQDLSRQGLHWRSFPTIGIPYGVSPSLRHWLAGHVHEYALVHVHGVFTFASLVARRSALRAGVPFLVRPLGILNRWGMEQRRPWVKKRWFRWVEKPSLDRASGLHFTSEEEARDVARLQIKAPGFVIPLGLDLSPYEQLPSPSLFAAQFPAMGAAKSVLFLSRIDVKKGLDVLLPAFKAVCAQVDGVKLIIAGDGDPQLIENLKRESQALGISDSVLWTGFLSGPERLAALAQATVFCLPSRSENFGMALLEAMAAGLPCVSTDQVALSVEAARAGAVCMTPVAAAPVAAALIQLLSDAGLRADLASKARDYATRHHSMAAVAGRIKSLYERVCAASPPRVRA